MASKSKSLARTNKTSDRGRSDYGDVARFSIWRGTNAGPDTNTRRSSPGPNSNHHHGLPLRVFVRSGRDRTNPRTRPERLRDISLRVIWKHLLPPSETELEALAVQRHPHWRGPLFSLRNGERYGLGNGNDLRSEEHTSELQSLRHLVCR